MWIFLNDAFLSIVAHREEPDRLMVRARFPGDIEAAFPGVPVSRTPEADYLYRAVIDRRTVATAIAARVLGISYPNFKNSLPAGDRQDAYLSVWNLLYDRQEQICENAPAPPGWRDEKKAA